MKTKKHSMMSIAMLVSNITVVIGGIFFFPQLSDDIFKGAVLMGIVTAISIVLLLIDLRRKEFSGATRNLLFLSYAIAGLVVFRWLVTIIISPNGLIVDGVWGPLL